MLFSKSRRDRTRWRLRFAILPTTVGTLPNGKVVRVWGEFYEVRFTPSGGELASKERRPRRQIPGLTHYGPWDNDVITILFPWIAG